MGFLDKVKQKAQEGVKVGQEKLEGVQARRRAEALLRDLGAAVYAERTGRGGDGGVEVERLVAELRSHEAEHGPLNVAPTADRSPDEPGAPSSGDDPDGGFQIDEL